MPRTPPDVPPTLARAAVPMFITERYHRSFAEELPRLWSLVDQCDHVDAIEDDTSSVRRVLASLDDALAAHVREQERTGGVFELVARGERAPPPRVDVALFEILFDLRTEALVLAEADCCCRKALRFGLCHLADEIEDHLTIERRLFETGDAACTPESERGLGGRSR